MVHKYTVCLFVLFIGLLSGCGNEESAFVELKKKEMFEFYVGNSDLIAVVEVQSVPVEGKKEKWNVVKQAKALVVKSIKGGENNTITILNNPYFKMKDSLFDIAILRNGTYLAFLKKNISNDKLKYMPLNGVSLIAIFDGKIQPVWEDVVGASDKDGIYLETVVSRISQLLKHEKS